ncbi:LysR family transcriptional regulator [Magnetospirillum sp. 64-120]|uniref:helix-turn-helix domain-containing protein n=1 Tax=Magnetospirillum sp. 64-120 TaxID=1895778 RepID=UPI00092598B3|nr:LysR family transcriptional regulator [Magnetospirillum sp. 64-120]OJX78193.1 MAG: hypothetical protein BGO92_02085 [Magnetospirillum sp. 64-120]
MELRHLRYVVAAADCGSFRRAAKTLEIQETAISCRIRDLEDEIDRPRTSARTPLDRRRPCRGPNSRAFSVGGDAFAAQIVEVGCEWRVASAMVDHARFDDGAA